MRISVGGKRVCVGVAATREEAAERLVTIRERIRRGVPIDLARLAANDPQSFVYFVQDWDERGAIKIGCAKNLAKRLLNLQTSAPRKLRLLCAVPGGPRLEAALHAAFASSRMSGEWFEPTDDLLALVDEFSHRTILEADRQASRGEEAREA